MKSPSFPKMRARWFATARAGSAQSLVFSRIVIDESMPGELSAAPNEASSIGHIDLGFGFDAYASVAVPGMFGIVPSTGIAVAVTEMAQRLHLPVTDALLMPIVLLTPILLPCALLRARQPKGARIAWSDAGLEELDGDVVRARIRWDRATATYFMWRERRRCHAIQVVDAADGTAITCWTSPPSGVPSPRRRMAVSDHRPLLEALRHRGVQVSEERGIDFARIDVGARPRPWLVSTLGFVGYVAATMALAAAPGHPAFALQASVVALLGLLVRALPALREWRTLQLSSRETTPVEHLGPYRAMAHNEDGDPRIPMAALRRAAGMELTARACVAIVPLLFATLLAVVR